VGEGGGGDNSGLGSSEGHFTIQLACHGLPPFLPNFFFPFLYLTLGRFSSCLPNLPIE